jgi:hypothetical protein
MMTFGGMMRTGAAALLLAGIATGAQAFSGAGGAATGFGGGGRHALRITGKLVCANCSLEEARETHPALVHLYQLMKKNGRAVMEVTAVNDSIRWGALTWPPRLWVRAGDEILRQLTAETNLAKKIEMTGLLSSSRTFDVVDIDIHG